MLFGPQKADKDHQDKKAKKEAPHAPDANQEEDKKPPSPEEILVTLQVQVDSCSPADLLALTTILLGGTPAVCLNRLLWIQAVKDHFDDVPLFVSNCKQLQLVFEAATHVGFDVRQADVGGCHQECDLVVLLQGATPFPDSGAHVSFRARNVQEGHTTPVDPQLVNITGLGGHDLEGSKTMTSASVPTSMASLIWPFGVTFGVCWSRWRTTCLPGGFWGL